MKQSAYPFQSRAYLGDPFLPEDDGISLKDEPMFFNSDFAFAMEHGGPATRAFLKALPIAWRLQPLVFDSRVHMLMPGWYPAIPGFHHDDVPRPAVPVGQHFGTAGQPDYDAPRYHSEHIMGLINADIAPTEFAIGSCAMPPVPDNDVIYRVWHLEVARMVKSGELSSFVTPDRHLLHFNCHSFHQATQAKKSGWRWFGRVSRNTERTATITNEIRRQVQVYLEYPMEGW